jgi:Ca-activated chloride channel family protein
VWAVEEFNKTPRGQNVKINLKKQGSIEGAMAVLKDDQTIHAWSPASGLYLYNLTDDWGLKHTGENPIYKSESLALTPMVFVMWEDRYQAFMGKYGTDGGVNFKNIEKAIRSNDGWAGIAGKPDWGFFKFGHTHPNQSNSGLMTLVLLAYDYHGKTSGLSMTDITNSGFQTWNTSLEKGVTGLSNSTGNMMKEMVQRGPSTYDALFLYENTAIDYLANAEGRWGKLRVVYPARNAWNDSPFYVLNVPWSSKRQREAATAFMDFLLSEKAQQQALTHGFRPANVQVPINGPESPFTKFKDYGVQIDVPAVCEQPSGEVIRNLLLRWQQTRGN